MPGWITSKNHTICKNSPGNHLECPLKDAAHAPQGNILTINFSNCCRNDHLRGPYGSTWQKQLWSSTTYIYSSTVLRLIFKYLYFAPVFPYSATLGSHSCSYTEVWCNYPHFLLVYLGPLAALLLTKHVHSKTNNRFMKCFLWSFSDLLSHKESKMESGYLTNAKKDSIVNRSYFSF